tara:strand:+ start:598 stop:915 length:318 start_codon:yes stop_codon:yes gene_type:complete
MTRCCGVDWKVTVLRCLHCGTHLDKIKASEITDNEVTVKVQQMFPNCQKYDPCCDTTDMEKIMEKSTSLNVTPVEAVAGLNIVKKISPTTKNPFPEDDVLGEAID